MMATQLTERNRKSLGSWFLQVLTTIHATGSLILVGMTLYVLAGESHSEELARTPGARIMVDTLGRWLPAFLGGLACFLAVLAWSSYRRRPWAWYGAIIAYLIGVLGSAWEISVGIQQAWISLAINTIVVTLLLSHPTREAYFASRRASHRARQQV
jgi:hypothetical protein